MRSGNSFNPLILSVRLLKLHIDKSASLMVLGFEPVDKPIIPRRSFFNKAHFLGYTGMFSSIVRPTQLWIWISFRNKLDVWGKLSDLDRLHPVVYA